MVLGFFVTGANHLINNNDNNNQEAKVATLHQIAAHKIVVQYITEHGLTRMNGIL